MKERSTLEFFVENAAEYLTTGNRRVGEGTVVVISSVTGSTIEMVDAVKKVYPIAQIAKAKMATMEEELCRLPTKKAQKEYIKQIYHEIKDEYTPVLKHMTRTQGRVLLKLIDRETEYTAYEVLKEFRGGFVAGFWQGVSKIFGQNLKSEYDREGEDRMIEQIVIYYEAGLLR